MAPTVPESPDPWQRQRDHELEEAHREHNERTGGGPIHEGEMEAERIEHNERTGGGPV
jgi:hypothetical protein